MSEKVEADLM